MTHASFFCNVKIRHCRLLQKWSQKCLMECVFLPSYLLEPYEKLLTPEARKLLEQQALDCLKNAKTEADRKECVKNLPKNLRKEILDKNSLEAYKTPQNSRTNPLIKETPKLLSLRERSWKNQRFTETITLSPKKANSKYNDLQERLPFLCFMACSLQCWSAP